MFRWSRRRFGAWASWPAGSSAAFGRSPATCFGRVRVPSAGRCSSRRGRTATRATSVRATSPVGRQRVAIPSSWDGPAESLAKLAFLHGAIAAEVSLRLQDPPLEMRLTGSGIPKFLDRVRELYPGQILPSREVLELPQTGWYQGLEGSITSGQCVHIYRQNAGLTLPTLAEVSGVARRWLARCEDGLEPLSETDARLLALYLECDYRSLLGRAPA